MLQSDIDSILSGISGVLVLFFTIGGSVLVVLASIWAFKRVQFLFTSDLSYKSEDYKNYSERKKYGG